VLNRQLNDLHLNASADATDLELLLGQVFMILCSDYRRDRDTIGKIKEQVVEAAAAGNCRVVFNRRNSPVAYVAWARLAEDVENRILEIGDCRLHRSEWNEGDRLWITDFSSPVYPIRSVGRLIVSAEFSADRELNFLRRKGASLIHHRMALRGGVVEDVSALI
jgi:cytolysin-activating lysine-acyltransferase